MTKKILPVVDPPIHGFLYWGFTLSITMKNEKSHPWFYTNFIQLHCNRDFLEKKKKLRFDFYLGRYEYRYNNPFLITQMLSPELFPDLKGDRMIDFFIHAIDQGYYPVPFVDEHYLSQSPSYKNRHLPHHVMLCGYDLERELFIKKGFDRKGLFGKQETTFTEIKSAYDHMLEELEADEKNEFHPDHQRSFLFKYNEQYSYDFSIDQVQQQIEEYLEAKTTVDTLHQDLKNEAFGVEVYDYLVLYMEALVGNHPDLIDHNIVRHLHILWEHKKALHDRLLYLMKNEYMEHNEAILEISSQNIQKAVYMRNYVLKRLNSVFVSTKKLQADLIKMKEILEEIKNAEIEMLQRVLEELDKSKLKQKSILT